MLRKFFVIVALFAVGASFLPAFAARPEAASFNADLPDQAGVYDVPGHSNLKLKVIVYHGKPNNAGKPTPPPPSEVCNLSDPDSSAVTPVDPNDPWFLPSDWTYNLNPGSAPGSIGAADAATIAENAFAPWENALGGAIDIIRGSNTSVNRAQLDGQNIVSWGRTSGSALAVTYIWYDVSVTPHPATEIDMIMNQKFSWEWSDPATWAGRTAPGTTCAFQGVYDAQDIMAHEFGHWFGLNDVYTADYQNNSMYGYGARTETKKNSLTTGDIIGVQQIYQ